jgi:hypothetical protein
LENEDREGQTELRPALDEIAEALTRRHLVVILSDLLGDPKDTLNGIRHLRHCGHEPIVLHLLDPAELTFPFDRAVRFEELEGTGMLLTDPRVMRERYLHEVNEYIRTLRRGCHRQQADYELLNTAAPLNTALTAYLATRSSRSRHWR